jgi:hypothetical protein
MSIDLAEKCPKCCVLNNQGGRLTIERDDWTYCNMNTCGYRKKTKKIDKKPETPIQLDFAHPQEIGGVMPGTGGNFGQLICQQLSRGSPGTLRDRLETLTKKRRHGIADPDIAVGTNGSYIVSEASYLYGQGGWSQVG